MPDILKIEQVRPEESAFQCVLDLHRAYKKFLGFLPTAAFTQFAEEGHLLVCRSADAIVGYLAFRVAANEAALVHLCVDEPWRGRGACGALLGRLFELTKRLAAIRLWCRQDYPANRLWPRYNFEKVDEKPGRGQDEVALLKWVRFNVEDAPLIKLIERERRREKATAVLDANVFMQLDEDSDQAEESKSLLADWLQAEVVLCVTAELPNEVSRNSDASLRARREAQMALYPMLRAGEAFDEALNRVQSVLPKARTVSDESDRRQLAHSLAQRAHYFVTRDQALLDLAEECERELGIQILRPIDLVCRIHGDLDPSSYVPARLLGTQLVESRATRVSELIPFQAHGEWESKKHFLALCRRLLSQPDDYLTRVVTTNSGEPVLAYSVEDEPSCGRTSIRLIRAAHDRLGATVLRRAVAELITSRVSDRVHETYCTDKHLTPAAREALRELGFVAKGDDALVKTSLSGVLPLSEVSRLVSSLPGGLSPTSLEHLLWPLKLADGEVSTFVIPIRPHWAAELFDSGLAEGTLFGAKQDLALALENVYYSGSPVEIPKGSRILWYVSGSGRDRVGAIRAASLCLGTVRTTARIAARRFARLGIYDEQQVLKRAHNDPSGLVTAYRFGFTERFSAPRTWDQLQHSLRKSSGRGNQINSPVRVPNETFVELYAAGLELAHRLVSASAENQSACPRCGSPEESFERRGSDGIRRTYCSACLER